MKKRKNWKVAVGVVAVALIGVGVTAGISKGFTSWDIKGNFTKEVENKPVVYESHELFKTAFEKNKAELDSDTNIKETEVVIKKGSYLDTLDDISNGYINCVDCRADSTTFNYLDNNLGFFLKDNLYGFNFYGSNYFYEVNVETLKITNDFFPARLNFENNIFKNVSKIVLDEYFKIADSLTFKVKENSKLKKISAIVGSTTFEEYLTNDTINFSNYSFEIRNTNYEMLGELVDLTTAKKYMKIIEG